VILKSESLSPGVLVALMAMRGSGPGVGRFVGFGGRGAGGGGDGPGWGGEWTSERESGDGREGQEGGHGVRESARGRLGEHVESLRGCSPKVTRKWGVFQGKIGWWIAVRRRSWTGRRLYRARLRTTATPLVETTGERAPGNQYVKLALASVEPRVLAAAVPLTAGVLGSGEGIRRSMMGP